MEYYDRLYMLIQKAGMKPSTLGTELNMGNATIAKWKEGDPHFSSIIAVADRLNISLDYLAGRSENPNLVSPQHSASTFEIIDIVKDLEFTPPQINLLKKVIAAIIEYDTENQIIDEP